jgi:RNA polymerase-binding transcription factor DksA
MTQIKGRLRSYKGCTFVDAGPENLDGTGDNVLQVYGPTNNLCHSLLFDNSDPTAVNKAIEKAKLWVDEAQDQAAVVNPYFTDEELEEFKYILAGKVNAAQLEFVELQRIVNANDGPDRVELEKKVEKHKKFLETLYSAQERIEDKTYGICKVTVKLIDKARLLAVPYATMSEEGKAIEERNKEQRLTSQNFYPVGNSSKDLKKLAEYKGFTFYDSGSNPRKKGKHFFIICLSPSEQVHTMEYDPSSAKSLKGKISAAQQWVDSYILEKEQLKEKIESEKARKCRVCGCTEHDCRQCIEKTGSPCYWVDTDICSACVNEQPQETMIIDQHEPEIKVIDTRASANQSIKTVDLNNETLEQFKGRREAAIKRNAEFQKDKTGEKLKQHMEKLFENLVVPKAKAKKDQTVAIADMPSGEGSTRRNRDIKSDKAFYAIDSFLYNEHHVCLNPVDVVSLIQKGRISYTIYSSKTRFGWTYGYSYECGSSLTNTGGGGSGCSPLNKQFKSQDEAVVYACEYVIKRFEHYLKKVPQLSNQEKRLAPLRKLVSEYYTNRKSSKEKK